MSRAELQRRLQIGVKLRLVRHYAGRVNLAREVIAVQTNGFYTRGPDCAKGWVGFKKGQTIIATQNGFEIHWPAYEGNTDHNILAYEWVAEQSAPLQLQLHGAAQ